MRPILDVAREKLGIKVNHLLHGPTPVTMTIAGLGKGAMSMQVDLTDARLLFGSMGWTKPAGRTALVTCFNQIERIHCA